MSFECDNWGDARGKASEKLFDSLRSRPKTARDATTTQNLAPVNVGSDAVPPTGGAASKKRRGDRSLANGRPAKKASVVDVKDKKISRMHRAVERRDWETMGVLAEAEDEDRAYELLAEDEKERTIPEFENDSGWADVESTFEIISGRQSLQQLRTVKPVAPLGPTPENALRPDPGGLARADEQLHSEDVKLDSRLVQPGPVSLASKPVKQRASTAVVDLTLSEDEAQHSSPRKPHRNLASFAPPAVSKVWAVKVGWLPGLYHEEWVANDLTRHYPGGEKQCFDSVDLAQQWLLDPSESFRKDAIGRPPHTDHIDTLEFSKYLSRTWDPRNDWTRNPRATVKKLRYLFMQACADEVHVVDWWKHPLPQELLFYETNGTWPHQASNRDKAPPKPATTMLGLQPFALRPRRTPAHPAPQQLRALSARHDLPPPSTVPPTQAAAAVDPGSSAPSGLGPVTSSPLATTGMSQDTNVHAVKVGWFPGIYATKTDANYQTKHYKHKEQESFPTEQAAEKWLAEPSLKTNLDSESRPKTLGNIHKEAFMRFVADAWSARNEITGIKNADIMQKLKLLFKQACEDAHNDVNWTLQQLPQVLISREREIAKQKKAELVPLGLWSGALKPRNPVVRSSEDSQSRAQRLQQVAPPPPRADTSKYRASEVATHKVCSCGQPVPDMEQAVRCAGADCKFGTFHKACVGLGSRKVVDGWRCYQCRPKPPPGALAPSQMPPSSQAPRSSQLRSSTPPMTIIRSMTIPDEPAVPEPPLHPEQETVVSCIADGYNVFYTGSAGTGKSTVLKAFVKRLKEQGKKIDIVAPSGIAALNVGGTTIFAYAGWRPDSLKEPLHKLKTAGFGRNVRKRLCGTDVLVIDEISMVERDLLVRLDRVMREVRDGWAPQDEKGRRLPNVSLHKKNLPFGGCQIVVTGDFCQLPPVKPFRTCIDCGGDDLPGYHMQDARTMTCKHCRQEYADKDKWAFRSQTWADCEFKYFELKHIHRQSDKRFIDILQKCRYGLPLLPSQQTLLLSGKADPVGAVKLLPRKAEVESENHKNFDSLKSTPRHLECVDVFHWRSEEKTPELRKHSTPRYSDKPHGPLLSLKDHRLEEEIQLKEGMLIILLVNLDFKQGLVNGSQGKIIGWEKHDDAKVFPPREVRSSPSKPRGSRPSGKYDSPSKFKGRSGSPSRSSRFSKDSAITPEYVQIKEEQVRKFINRNNIKTWPVVEFHNGVVQPIYAHCEMSELGPEQPYSILGRTQIPLLAAWAITVHKSQGMTLNRVIVDLYNSFEREMVYVALSRARSLEGLKVLRLARQMERGVNEEVQGFLREHGLGGLH